MAAAVTFLVILLILAAFHVPGTLMVLVLVPFCLFAVGVPASEYLRRRPFYDRLQQNLAELDKKYLVPEVVPEPEFYEGRLLYEAACGMEKSMAEEVASYSQHVADFREYIEMWVHEAKLPIAALLLAEHNRETGEAEAAGILELLQRLDECTDQVLYYTRSEVAEQDFLIRGTSLGRCFSAAALKQQASLRAAGVEIRTENLGLSVMTDAKWLEFILGQLLANAVKYRDPDRPARIFVRGEEEERLIRLHVRDNGIGIPDRDLPRIFEKSFTGENGRRGAKSTGMGLYIVKKLCRKLGHEIEALSEEGEYTELVLTFHR